MALVNLETAINNLPVVVLAVDRERRIVLTHPLALALRRSDQQAERKQRMGDILPRACPELAPAFGDLT